MAGIFERYDDLCDNVPGAYQALLYCATHDVCVDGDCVEWLCDNHPELIADEVYDDFCDASRWSIGKAYILNIGGDYYRCWEEAGLTEMQPNEWYDQTFERVSLKKRVITCWMSKEEEEIFGV